MTKAIKDKINSKKSLCKSKKFIELQNLATDISEMISIRKDEYYDHLSKKLNNPNTSAKTYWSILKSFYKGTKVPLIPPLLVNNKAVSDFTEKANLFNDFFASQCTPISNNSALPSKKSFKTNKRLYKLNIKEDDILKIIRKLNVNKAHGHDDISIKMLKICDSVLTEPLSIIFKNSIDHVVFPDTWKMSHIIPIYKTNDKDSFDNYCPLSLLPICRKIFERTIFNVYAFLENINLLTPKQSGFRSNDSCVSQLLSIVHSAYSDFDLNFLHISKAFDKVWHERLLYKLASLGIA